MIGETPDGAYFRLVADALQPGAGGVDGGGRGARRVLRIEGQQQNARAALGLEAGKRSRNRRLTVTHRVVDHHAMPGLTEKTAQQLGLPLDIHLQRRASRQSTPTRTFRPTVAVGC
jgi:hypothetical protein